MYMLLISELVSDGMNDMQYTQPLPSGYDPQKAMRWTLDKKQWEWRELVNRKLE